MALLKQFDDRGEQEGENPGERKWDQDLTPEKESSYYDNHAYER